MARSYQLLAVGKAIGSQIAFAGSFGKAKVVGFGIV
jgi:hypothetical protein